MPGQILLGYGSRERKLLWLTQQQYTARVLARFDLTECRTHNIPMSPSVLRELLHPTDEAIKAAERLPYRELVGCLQYAATMTRPDIAFSVSRMATFNNGWSERHFEIAKGILRYIAGTRHHGLRLGGPAILKGYCDSDHATCPIERISVSGWFVQYGGTVAWQSRKQAVQSQSSAQTEYMAFDEIARDMVWERRNLHALGYGSDEPTEIAIDNKSAIAIAKNRTSHDLIKHIDIRYHYTRGLIARTTLQLRYIQTDLPCPCSHQTSSSFQIHPSCQGYGT